MPAWEDEPLGAFGSGAPVPTGQWFDVNTQTGQWGSPTPPAPTLSTSAGIVPVGMPDQAPLSIGQVAGPIAPPMTMPASLQRVQRLDQMGALAPGRSPWQDVLTAVGGAAAGGPGISQAFARQEQQQQQQLQNRLTMRRQQLQEEQSERAEIRDDFNSLLKLSEIKSKSLRKLYTDRFVADMQARGKTLPPDFVEAFKASGTEEAKAMVKFYEPLLADLGMDPAAFAELVDQGGIKEVGEALTLAQKVKKDKTEQARLAALDKIADGTLGDVSGVQTPPPAPPTGTTAQPPPPTAGPPARPGTMPPAIDTAVTEATKLYPQVRPDLVHGIIRHESNYDVGAVSPKGAFGLMQLMPGTAEDMGVDPKDPAQNVRGGVRYYAQMLTKYNGNEALALAAYNWGPGNVDKVGGDLTKMPAETQAYVKNVLASAAPGGARGPANTRMQVAGPGAPAPTTPAPTGGTPQEQAQLTALNTRITVLDKQIEGYTRIGGEEGRGRATATERQRDNLAQERDRLRTRMLEPTRAAERLEASKQTGTAAAERQLEAEMNKPIGVTDGRKMGLPPSTKWKDVPKDVRTLEDPSPAERQKFSDFKASQAGIGRVLTKLDQPGTQKIIGTLFSEPEASFNRRVGEWLSTVSPEQRKFVASMAAEIAEIRHALSGAAVSPQEFAVLKPMFPSPDDPDVATVRAKLEALQEWIVRKHDAYRDQLDQVGIRTPKALERPAETPPPGTLPPAKEDLLKKHQR